MNGTKLRSDQQEKVARQGIILIIHLTRTEAIAQRLRVLDQKLQRAQVPENLLHSVRS